MAEAFSDKGRIGRAGYWQHFVGNLVVVGVLLFATFGTAMSGSIGAAIIPMVLMAAAGLYFRVIMMRRCRDIGWPAFLPWAFFGGLFVTFLFSGISAVSLDLGSVMASMAFAQIIALGDFVLMIVIGCLPPQQPGQLGSVPPGYYDSPDRQPARVTTGSAIPQSAFPRAASPVADLADGEESSGHDAAIARALADYHARQSAPADIEAAPASIVVTTPRTPAFGRKGL